MNDTQKEILETVPVEYKDRVTSEANISWGLSGGTFSGHLSRVASYVNKCVEAGTEPSFPKIEWNRKDIERRRNRRRFVY